MKTLIASAVVATIASTSQAAILDYEFDFTVESNTITSGAFTLLTQGEQLTIRYRIETTQPPTFTGPDQNHWTFSGTTASNFFERIRVYNSSFSHTLPGIGIGAAQAFVLDDQVLGADVIDSFQLRGIALSSDPDVAQIGVNLQARLPGTPPNTSLTGTHLPTTQSELDVTTFDFFAGMNINGPGNAGQLLGTITAARVPSPMTLACLAPAALVATRRRR